MKNTAIFAAILCGVLAGCSASEEPEAPAPQQVGGDRDEHGCIASAGYSWCARTNQCERPWELAQQQGFENTEQGFAEYCSDN